MKKFFYLIVSLLFITQGAQAANFTAYRTYLKGLSALKAGDVNKAVSEYERTVRYDPSALGVYKELAYIHFQKGDVQKALEAAEKIKELDGNSVQTNIFLGTFYLVANNMDLSKQAWERVLELDPQNEIATVYLAAYYYSDKNFERSQDYWEKFLSSQPDNAEGFLQLALVQEKLGLSEKALTSYNKVIELKPEAREAYLAKARIYEANNKMPLAVEVYENYIEIFPDNENVLMYLGRCYFELAEYSKAKQTFMRAQKIDPENILIRYWLAAVYEKEGNINKVIKEFEYIVQKEPSVAAFTRLGFYYGFAQNFSKAETVFTRALEMDPLNLQINYLLGLLYIDWNKYEKAKMYLQKVVNADPKFTDALFYLATVRDKLGDFDLAERELKQVIAQNPRYAKAMNYLGYTLAERGEQLNEAEQLLKHALEIEPKNPAYLDSLGWVYYKQNKFQEALTYVSEAVALYPDPVIYEHLGSVYIALENFDMAWLAYACAVDLGSETAPKQLKTLQKNLAPQNLAFLTLQRAEANFARLSSLKSLYRLEIKFNGFNLKTYAPVTYKKHNLTRIDFPPRYFTGGENYVTVQNGKLTFFPNALKTMVPQEFDAILKSAGEIFTKDFFAKFEKTTPLVKANKAVFTSQTGNTQLTLNLKTGVIKSISNDNATIDISKYKQFNLSTVPSEIKIDAPSEKLKCKAALKSISGYEQ